MIKIERDVYYTQAKGVWFCLHVGTTVLYIGKSNKVNRRLEVITPRKKWRYSVFKDQPKPAGDAR